MVSYEAQHEVPSNTSNGLNTFNGSYTNSSSNMIVSNSSHQILPNAQLQTSYSGEEAQSGGIIITLSNNENNVTQSVQADMTQESMSLPTDQSISNFQFIKQDEDGQYIIQNSENVKFDKNGTVQVLVQDAEVDTNTYDNKTVTLSDNFEDSIIMTDTEGNTLPPNIEKQILNVGGNDVGFEDLNTIQQDDSDVVTKELYLCGSCSECFSSIQDCKDHMTNVHEVTDFQTSGKVDTGTQMEPKKTPGRKKKSEKLAAALAAANTQDDDEDDDIVMSESDEDWTEQMLSYSTRSRRQRRPPQALRNDYYLGRTKKKESVKKDDMMNVRCSVKGCSARFKDESTMISHLQCHIEGAGPSENQFRCLTCEETFPIWKQARYHMWKIHRQDIGCLLSCPVCDNFKTDVPCKLKIHMEVHGTERRYPCSICNKTFKQFAQMKNHEHSHKSSDDQSTEYSNWWHTPKTCDICNRKFANIKCMKMHRQAVHGGKKPFACTYCPYACARKAMLMLHLRTHTGEKPHKCDLCSYSCSDHNSMRRHKMRHTGVKPYKCLHCPYSCIQAISLKIHMKNKHPGMEGIYCCEMCSYRTVNEQQYKNHLNDHKNGLVKTDVAPQPVKTLENELYVMKNVPGKDGFVLSRADGRFDSIPGQDSVIQVLQAPDIQNPIVQQMLRDSVTPSLPSSTFVLDSDQVRELQIRASDTGENIIAEDFTRIASGEALHYNDVTAAQLIYTALNAISEAGKTGTDSIDSQGLVEGVENGTIQTSIEMNSVKEGETNHVITFHLTNGEELKREVTLQEQTVTKDEMPVVQVQDNNVSNWPVM
ncbi:hypothetical protein ACF0H5_006145 [Mactra antiquata]